MTATAQALEALAEGNERRFRRAAVRRELRALPDDESLCALADIFESVPRDFERIEVGELLCFGRCVGRSAAIALTKDADLHALRWLSEATPRQRELIARRLREAAIRRAA